jgi:hypothetical protein
LDPRGLKEQSAEKKLNNEELHKLYCSPDIIRMLKSRGSRWAGHVVHMGEKACKVFGGEARRKKTTRKT